MSDATSTPPSADPAADTADRAAPPRVDVLMITHRRPDYTRLALPRLLEATGPHVNVWVWHNGDHAETLEVVQAHRDHPRLARFHHSRENLGLRAPTNWLWTESDAPYVSKVDDDCLVDHAFTDPMLAAHVDVPRLGVVGAWRFLDEDYRRFASRRKMVTLPGEHQLLRNLWVQGSSYVMKREIVERLGPLPEGVTFPQYCRRAAAAGWLNGWLYPFVREQHLDDPRFRLSALRDPEVFAREAPLSARMEGVHTVDQWRREMTISALRVQRAPLNPARHDGLPGKVIQARKRVRRLLRRAGVPL
ncbi:glycosyltransferase [Egicoccus halophilus]|uniref:Glycosyltransferase 2-like domain-containing protein n=1 Tax=Egicoccus halophilus TaxID=1670830 RepID=A0A8J3ETI9_9ACTN|nr:glycosyltransferase [Egicoccus halophilus]GGI05288.1 hypothetical protein GCM10011354_13350 [Egicoccus halophilus]